MTTIEPLSPELFQLVAGWLSNHEVNRWLTSEWRARPADSALVAIAVRNKRNRIFLVRQGGTPVGLVGLADVDPQDHCAMVWYVLGTSTLGGRGFITDAVRQVCRLGFQELGLRNIYAWIMEPNQKSRRVLEKNGFTESGHLRRAADMDGQSVDRVYFDLTPEDATN